MVAKRRFNVVQDKVGHGFKKRQLSVVFRPWQRSSYFALYVEQSGAQHSEALQRSEDSVLYEERSLAQWSMVAKRRLSVVSGVERKGVKIHLSLLLISFSNTDENRGLGTLYLFILIIFLQKIEHPFFVRPKKSCLVRVTCPKKQGRQVGFFFYIGNFDFLGQIRKIFVKNEENSPEIKRKVQAWPKFLGSVGLG